jgi:hypothetical protein
MERHRVIIWDINIERLRKIVPFAWSFVSDVSRGRNVPSAVMEPSGNPVLKLHPPYRYFATRSTL